MRASVRLHNKTRTVAAIAGILLWVAAVCWADKEEQMWQRDMTNEITIGPADSGYKKVELRCLDEKKLMQVDIELDEDFYGVIYTRGNFKSKNKKCYMKPKPGTKFKLQIPFEECGTKKEGEVFRNTIIIQYDDELIMPGDAAFALECDLGPREVTLTSTITTTEEDTPQEQGFAGLATARISLADADPAGKPLPKHRQSTVEGPMSTSFTPEDVRPRKRKRAKQEL